MKMVNIRNVDLNLLAIFAVLAREKNVSRAAKELHLTQSAVSHALNRLRSTFNDPLFVRQS
jgi:DNA-binding transcriptional LysR family regulator